MSTSALGTNGSPGCEKSVSEGVSYISTRRTEGKRNDFEHDQPIAATAWWSLWASLLKGSMISEGPAPRIAPAIPSYRSVSET